MDSQEKIIKVLEKNANELISDRIKIIANKLVEPHSYDVFANIFGIEATDALLALGKAQQVASYIKDHELRGDDPIPKLWAIRYENNDYCFHKDKIEEMYNFMSHGRVAHAVKVAKNSCVRSSNEKVPLTLKHAKEIVDAWPWVLIQLDN